MSKIVADHWRGLDFYKPATDPYGHILIAGAGAIGSYVAYGLLRMGVKRITVVDFDKVEPHNLPNQFFAEDGLVEEVYKTSALTRTITFMMPDAKLTTFPLRVEAYAETEHYKSSSFTAVVSAVDNMDVRKWMFDRFKHIPLFLDSRTGGLFANVYSIIRGNEIAEKYYEKSLYSNEEAVPLPCSGQAVVDVSMAVSAELIARYRTFALHKKLLAIHTFHDYKIGQAYGMSYYANSGQTLQSLDNTVHEVSNGQN